MSFSFGTPSSAPATTGLTGGFSFGANKPSTTGFGLTATTQATGLFGAPATSAPAFGAATGSAPAFGTTPAFEAAAPTFGANKSFGATSNAPAFGATTSLSFGVSSAPTFGATTPAFGATTTPSFGANTSFGGGGLSFGTGTSTVVSTGLSFGTTTTTSTGLGGLGGFGFGASTQSNWSLGCTATTTTSAFAAPSLGLGGVAQSGVTNTTSTDGKSEPPMQQKLPNEISTTVESFKEFVKKQKTLSSDIMRISIKPLHKVSQEAETTLRAAAALRGEVTRACKHAQRLRAAAAAADTAAETAARDAPGTDLEGPVPPQYVSELISELEQQLATFRKQMDVADKQMQASPKPLTEQELSLGIRRMHSSLVSLAARLQATHSLVSAQKERWTNLRKYVLKDTSDVFDAALPAPSLGLGGVAQSGVTNTTSTDGKSEPPMQQKLPNEISTTVESFKEFVKKQKTLSSDIMRISIKPLHKVSQEAETTLRAAAALRGEVTRACKHAQRLRAAAAAADTAAETAARDAPGTDLEGPVPPQYVSELISELEQQLATFRKQMDVADKQMQASPKPLTEQELSLGIRRMHSSLVSLAARLQATHSLVSAQKERWTNLRKYVLKDTSDVFDAALRNIQRLAGLTPFTYLGNSMSSLPASDNTGSNWHPQLQTNSSACLNLSFGSSQSESGFQLQKPPGKRGKQ